MDFIPQLVKSTNLSFNKLKVFADNMRGAERFRLWRECSMNLNCNVKVTKNAID